MQFVFIFFLCIQIAEGVVPRYRIMASFEQKVEPRDRAWQYLVVAAEPYETIAFKVPSWELDRSSDKLWSHWNHLTRQYFLQVHFRLGATLPTSLPPSTAGGAGAAVQ